MKSSQIKRMKVPAQEWKLAYSPVAAPSELASSKKYATALQPVTVHIRKSLKQTKEKRPASAVVKGKRSRTISKVTSPVQTLPLSSS